MSLDAQNVSYLLGLAGLGGIVFSIYKQISTPQNALDKRQALLETEVNGDTKLIEEKVLWEKEATDRRFGEMSKHMSDSLALAQNHIHTVDTKVDTLSNAVNTMNLNLSSQIMKLGTIIEERIPKEPKK